MSLNKKVDKIRNKNMGGGGGGGGGQTAGNLH